MSGMVGYKPHLTVCHLLEFLTELEISGPYNGMSEIKNKKNKK